MKKKILTVVLSACLTFSQVIPAFAENLDGAENLSVETVEETDEGLDLLTEAEEVPFAESEAAYDSMQNVISEETDDSESSTENVTTEDISEINPTEKLETELSEAEENELPDQTENGNIMEDNPSAEEELIIDPDYASSAIDADFADAIEMNGVSEELSTAAANQTNAISISVNTSYSGFLANDSDEKWYKFTLTNAGYICLDFTHDYVDSSGRYWEAHLYDSSYQELAWYGFVGSTVSYKTENMGVGAGTYYLKITKYYYSDKKYNIKINYTASNAWEKEFNETYNTANSINVNATYYGSLRTGDDVDFYKYTIPNAGYISLDFAHDYVDSSGRYWEAQLYDSSYQELAWYGFAGSTVSYKTENIGVGAGTYYLKITKYYHSDKKYNIKINYTASNAWEKEFNETYNTADSINVNATYYGSLRTEADVDCYKFSVPNAGCISLDFAHDYVDSSGRYWEAHLYDSSYQELAWYGFAGSTVSYKTENIGVGAGTYYLKITKYYHSDKKYNIKINYTASNAWEKEFNDTFDTANSISVNATYHGNLRTDDDDDYFKFSLPSAGYMSFNFAHAEIDSNEVYWVVYLYNGTYKELAKYNFSGSELLKTTPKISVSAGNYYIKINKNNHTDKEYQIRVNYSNPSAAVHTTGISGVNTNITLEAGKSIALHPTITPSNSQDPVRYASVAPNIATVSSSGVIKGIKAGSAYIYVKSGTKYVKILVKVTAPAVVHTTSISGLHTGIALEAGKTTVLHPVIKPANSQDPVRYASVAPNIATVSASGVVKGIKAGSAYIYVKSGTKYVKILVKVTAPSLKAITGVRTTGSLRVGATYQLRPQRYPAGSAGVFYYKSSNPAIATVDKNGKITAKKKGTTTITVTARNVSTTMRLTVK